MSRDFYDLCYDQYKQEMAEADRLYQKAGVMLVAVPLIGTLAIKLSRLDIIKLCFTRVDICLLYVSFAVASFALTASIVYLFLCVYPRTYKTMANIDAWQKWREDYQKYLREKEAGEAAEGGDSADAAMMENLCQRLVEAQPVNAEINEKRRKALRQSILLAAIAFATVGLEALFSLILRVQGV